MRAMALALCLAVLPAAIAGDAFAVDRYNVSAIKYHNKGGYQACIDLRWENAKGEVKKLSHEVMSGGQCAYNPDTVTLKLNKLDTDTKPKVGDEVWAVINILYGDNRGCRKDSQKFYYSKNGGTVRYETKGTTKNNNHCILKGCKNCPEKKDN
jgi:hypothetical protein